MGASGPARASSNQFTTEQRMPAKKNILAEFSGALIEQTSAMGRLASRSIRSPEERS
jgi:hypothetical protein